MGLHGLCVLILHYDYGAFAWVGALCLVLWLGLKVLWLESLDVSNEPSSKFKTIKDQVNITPPTDYPLNTDKGATIAEVSNINQELVKMKFGPFDDVVNISQADGSLLELPNANTNSHMDKAIENVREVDKNLGVEDPITDLTTPVVVGPGCIMNMEVSEHVQNQEGFSEMRNNNLVQSNVACSPKPAPIPKENHMGKGHIETKTSSQIDGVVTKKYKKSFILDCYVSFGRLGFVYVMWLVSILYVLFKLGVGFLMGCWFDVLVMVLLLAQLAFGTGLGCEVELSQCQFCYAYPSFAMLQSKQCVAMLILKFDTHLGFNVGHADNNVGQVDLALRGAWISCCGLLLCIGSGLWFLRVMSGSPALSQCFGSGLWL
ncbi:hypothetical protein U1Q18_045091 [Sarracenia purpurea var. burkii]